MSPRISRNALRLAATAWAAAAWAAAAWAAAAMPAWAAARYEFRVTDDYRFGYRAEITIVNEAADETIADWTLVLRFPQHRIDASWQTRFRADPENGVYVLGRAPNGPVIPPGRSYSFTIAGTPGNVSAKPELMALDTTVRPAKPAPADPAASAACDTPVADVTVSPASDSTWATGYTYSITLVNGTDRPVGPWQLEFLLDPAMRVSEQWDAFVYARDGDRYRLRPLAYNARLQPGDETKIGFNVRWDAEGTEPRFPYEYRFLECR